MEHPRELINRAQWGQPGLPGVKAAEYRLTAKNPESLPVYTFCMCPGGVIVPATPYENTNIVNGMSLYLRNQKFANAACVAGISMEKLLGRETSPMEAIEWLGALENRFYEYSSGYQAPFCGSGILWTGRNPRNQSNPVIRWAWHQPLYRTAATGISMTLRAGLGVFSNKLKGFDTGIIMGLESKTSAPVQAIRDENRRCAGFKNLLSLAKAAAIPAASFQVRATASV
ncbi:MAG: hypothetical protein R2861_01200 [Desulfobacterales bacterium]